MDRPQVVSRDEWLAARKELLAQEKQATRVKDAVDTHRRALPMAEVGKEYVFAGPRGQSSLADLFDGRRQLIFLPLNVAPAQTRTSQDARSWRTTSATCPSAFLRHPPGPGVPGRWPASGDSSSGWAGRCPGIPRPAATSTTTSTSAPTPAPPRWSTTTRTRRRSNATTPIYPVRGGRAQGKRLPARG